MNVQPRAPMDKPIRGADATISLPAFGIDLPLAEIYRGVQFD